ncbi:MAG: DUF1573 domain-containing protein [Chthoniobacterales bacterium]
MKIRVLFIQCLFTLALLAPARAALTWESTEADLHPALSDKTAVARFKYKNTGDKPVKITSVHSSCGCTTAALAKDEVAPDESGEIVATFNIGGRTGVQKKNITVTTDAAADNPTILKLTATIPTLLEIAPTFIFWSADDTLEPKTINITVGGDVPVTNLNVTSTDKSIATEVKRESDKLFHLIVTPQESGRPINAALKIKPNYPKDNAQTFYANVRVDSRAAKPSK